MIRTEDIIPVLAGVEIRCSSQLTLTPTPSCHNDAVIILYTIAAEFWGTLWGNPCATFGLVKKLTMSGQITELCHKRNKLREFY